ncbi:hypothetical protein [Metabacillus fastidiosus]|uniref:hypothetical protein n=1 Tax=Metabacillus fastidiosus TaxID=1458 RepID=UPI002DB5AB3C|nr:hypothetical protein [Metabacillus fastidiosus]MEC2077893.1 hypothetical protein [Metabacillus fastidiosus]
MKLVCKEEVVQFDGQPSVEQIIQKINELLANNYYFSHLVVDGEEVYEEPENYLLSNSEYINELEISVKTEKEFINDMLLTAEEYIKRARMELGVLADGFYQNPNAEQWNHFAQMMEGLQWLNQVIGHIDRVKEKPKNHNEYIKLNSKLQMEIRSLHEAVENEDYVLTGDLIQYELVPIYEALEIEITTTIDTEGYRHDLN